MECMNFDPEKFPEIEVKPRYAPCHKCKKPVDMSELYTVAYPDGKKQILHIECFHEDYTPDEDEPKA